MFTTALRLSCILVVLSVLPVLTVSNLVLRQDVDRSRERFEATQRQLVETRARFEEMETRLLNLTQREEAVELEARRYLRMIRPGEDFYIIQSPATASLP